MILKSLSLTIGFIVAVFAVGCRPSEPRANAEPPTVAGTNVSDDTPVALEAKEGASVEGPKLMPADEAAKDPTLVEFRERLLEAVRSRDEEFLFEAIDPNIRTGFGPVGGATEFRRHWRLDTADSPLWDELETILALGGSFNPSSASSQFWAPYVYSAWPEQHDAFRSLAVIEEDVPMHESPDPQSPVIGRLSYDIVKNVDVPAAELAAGWTRVRTVDGRSGWVNSLTVRSPVGYRAGFTRRNGEWKLSAFVSGD
ncbi:MAG TPA: SH3 domain-containing protein [Thermoanaerobaculia bacterium]